MNENIMHIFELIDCIINQIIRMKLLAINSIIRRAVIGLLILPLFFSNCSNSGIDFTIEPTVNPNKIAPLTAILDITSDLPCRASIKVLGDDPVEQAFDESGTSLSIPVVGLYPGTLNRVEVTLDYEGGQVVEVVEIMTDPLPDHFPGIDINKLERENMEPGMHALDIHFANFGKFRSAPIIFDDKGVIRWYLDLSFHGAMVSPFQRMKDGNILVVGRHTIYEFDMLGRPIRKAGINPNYGMHHDVLELPNGDLLICVGKRDAFVEVDGKRVQSDNDFLIQYDRKRSRVVKEWDMAEYMDVSRADMNFFRQGDWLHMNALEFVEADSSIIVSGRNQGLVKISWNGGLKWIMSPKQNWGRAGRDGNGKETNPYLLTAVNSENKPYGNDVQTGNSHAEDFDFPWGPHSPELLSNGNIIVFDNGPFRNYGNENMHSRAVEYRINEDQMTIEQVWQYGKERGAEFFSSIVSDVDFLPASKNII